MISSSTSSSASLSAEIPVEFVRLSADRLSQIDRRLGYFGNARFVGFYYEPRGDEVIWKDGLSYGFGAGAWQTFHAEVTPVLDGVGVNLGANGSAPQHMLVIDRFCRMVYVAVRAIAERFLADQQTNLQPG